MNDEIKKKVKRIDEISEALIEETIDENEGISEMLELMQELIALGYVPPNMFVEN